MQADAMHVDRSTPLATPVGFGTHPPKGRGVTSALRVVESFLLSGGQQTARRNAWNAVREDRMRARDRREALSALDSARGRFHQQPTSH